MGVPLAVTLLGVIFLIIYNLFIILPSRKIDGDILGTLGIVYKEVFGQFADLETAFGEGFEEGIFAGLVIVEVGILVEIELGRAVEGNFEFGFGEAGVFGHNGNNGGK